MNFSTNHLTPTGESYQLIDFGDGEKLERFSEKCVRRIAPAANNRRKRDETLWSNADLVFRPNDDGQLAWSDSDGYRLSLDNEAKSHWLMDVGPLTLRLATTPAGQVGFFPEHTAHWPMLDRLSCDGLKVLNLFAYTGSMTLKLASRGAHVTHVDSAASAVRWARENARLSKLDDRPVRWIVEDASKFVIRELKRGNFYDGFVCDPPTYGHGPKKQPWKIDQHFETLIDGLLELTHRQPKLAILSSHSQMVDDTRLAAALREATTNGSVEHGIVDLTTPDGRRLPSGWFARI